MKDTLIKSKNNFQGIKRRVDKAENQINDLEHKEPKNNHEEQEEKRIQKNEDSINSLWDNFMKSNSCLIGVPEGDNLVKKIDKQVQEAQRVPIMMDVKMSTPRHRITKMPNIKD